MQDAGFVRGGETIRDSDERLDNLVPVAPALLAPVAQRAAVHQLGHEVLPSLELVRIVHGEDVRMIERRGEPRFALEAPARRRVREIGGRNLTATARLSFVSTAR